MQPSFHSDHSSFLFELWSSTPNLMAVFDSDDRLIFANDAFREAYFVGPFERPFWRQLMHDNYRQGRGPLVDTDNIDAWLTEAQSRRGTLPYRAFEAEMTDGKLFWITETVDRDGSLFLNAFEISALHASDRELREERDVARRASWTDELTGIANRRYVLKTMEEWQSQQEHSVTFGNHALALLDLDHFKDVNDRFGHDVGDSVLVRFCQTVTKSIRRNDLFGRMGGEEFLIFFPSCTLEDAKAQLLNVQQDLLELHFADAPGYRCTFSAGVCEMQRGVRLDHTITLADGCLYGAKSAGRNRVVDSETCNKNTHAQSVVKTILKQSLPTAGRLQMQILSEVIGVVGATDDAESDTIQRALQAVRTHLGMEVAYLSEFVGNNSIFRVVDAPGLEDMIKPGDARSLDDVYCRHILAGRLPQLIPDTSREPICRSLPITAAVPIGAHVSIPIILPSGEPYGMFCCLSPQANPSLNARDLDVVRLFADVAAHQIGRQVADRNEVEDKKALIKGIIAQRQFKLVFQPIIQFGTGEVRGYEALCRFEPLPYRSPDVWINDAKSAGLGIELELAIIDRAFEVWGDGPLTAYIAFNVSPGALCDTRFRSLVDARDLSSVVFEITEHAAVDDYGVLNTQLDHLRAKGARIAIDDAGAGFSSLRHIVQLAPDLIKLDMALTRDIDSDPSRRALASAFVYFARETGAEIVAEGIESEAELQTLYALGINVGQGYYLSRPLERDAVTRASLGYGSAVSAARF